MHLQDTNNSFLQSSDAGCYGAVLSTDILTRAIPTTASNNNLNSDFCALWMNCLFKLLDILDGDHRGSIIKSTLYTQRWIEESQNHSGGNCIGVWHTVILDEHSDLHDASKACKVMKYIQRIAKRWLQY